jgi:hypothetical protein
VMPTVMVMAAGSPTGTSAGRVQTWPAAGVAGTRSRSRELAGEPRRAGSRWSAPGCYLSAAVVHDTPFVELRPHPTPPLVSARHLPSTREAAATLTAPARRRLYVRELWMWNPGGQAR